MTEAELRSSIRATCLSYGLVYHYSPDSRREKGGWPDLVIAGRGGILFRELKSDEGRLSLAQREVGSILESAGGDWAVWRPVHLASGLIGQRLAGLRCV